MAILTAPPPMSGDRSGTGLITPGFRLGFALVVSLFFLWAIANNLNDVLIRQFQKALDLNRAEAGLIQFVFYIGYFVMALPAGMVMRRFGYRAGIVLGLGLYAAGALLFWPAAEMRVYSAFLGALFVLAAGAACLETAANPYIVAFGDPTRAAQRLNLAQAFNGVGAVIAPIVGGLFIFSGVEMDDGTLAAASASDLAAYRAGEAAMVQVPYLVLALIVICVAVAIARVPLPTIRPHRAAGQAHGWRRLVGNPLLVGAVVAQFFYVAAQVGVWSYFIDFVKEVDPAVSERNAAFLLSGSLCLFTLGRFGGAALMQKVSPVTLLLIFAIANVVLCGLAMTLPGVGAIAALLLTGLFMSIMFPTIFALGVRDLGPDQALGSSLLIMSIIGGAIAPPIMGWISHGQGGLRAAMLLPLAAFAVVAVYGVMHRRADASPDQNTAGADV
ncbi:L-fucose:H+ symporter permease [Brevundimonas sp.]|jgi:FHS family L-fucose permease-like MFS transporter|uniref:L-fucose:H+ symporter permease n=1 Tax=Brevundimonas sp. TaxID=1871086 RepID=UPI0037840F2E